MVVPHWRRSGAVGEKVMMWNLKHTRKKDKRKTQGQAVHQCEVLQPTYTILPKVLASAFTGL